MAIGNVASNQYSQQVQRTAQPQPVRQPPASAATEGKTPPPAPAATPQDQTALTQIQTHGQANTDVSFADVQSISDDLRAAVASGSQENISYILSNIVIEGHVDRLNQRDPQIIAEALSALDRSSVVGFLNQAEIAGQGFMDKQKLDGFTSEQLQTVLSKFNLSTLTGPSKTMARVFFMKILEAPGSIQADVLSQAYQNKNIVSDSFMEKLISKADPEALESFMNSSGLAQDASSLSNAVLNNITAQLLGGNDSQLSMASDLLLSRFSSSNNVLDGSYWNQNETGNASLMAQVSNHIDEHGDSSGAKSDILNQMLSRADDDSAGQFLRMIGYYDIGSGQVRSDFKAHAVSHLSQDTRNLIANRLESGWYDTGFEKDAAASLR